MNISKFIRNNWHDLSYSAQKWVEKTRPHLLNRWYLSEEGEYYKTVDADDINEALETAAYNVDSSNYSKSNKTFWVEIYAENTITAESGGRTVQVDPEEPECSEREHNWDSPYELLGGLKENPGVWGKGGGVIYKEVCSHCGKYKITDTWAQNPENGEQGLTSVEYEDADNDSLEWLLKPEREIVERVLENYVHDPKEHLNSDSVYEISWETEYDDDDPVKDLNKELPAGWYASWTGFGNGNEESFIVKKDNL